MKRLPVLALSALLAAAPGGALAGDDRDGVPEPLTAAGTGPADRVTVEQQEAIERGLAWLARKQDGSGYFPTAPDGDTARGRTAVTALSLLSFLGAGHGLRHGPHRERVHLAVKWLLRNQTEAGENRGYIRYSPDGASRMHGHGFATLALAEAYGTAPEPADVSPTSGLGDPRREELRALSRRLRAGVQDAVDLIEKSQSLQGGWYYDPEGGNSTQHEGSVTVCMVQALVAASNRGFRVDMARIKHARKYMKDSQTRSGGFRYKLDDLAGSDSPGDLSYSWALAAAGVTSLVGLGEYDRRDAVERGLKFLEAKGAVPDRARTSYYFYGSFYAVQAFHWAGGDRWRRFWVPMRRRVLEDQGAEGSWSGTDGNMHLGDTYPTAMCLLMLEVPVGYLGIYAR